MRRRHVCQKYHLLSRNVFSPRAGASDALSKKNDTWQHLSLDRLHAERQHRIVMSMSM